MSRSAMHKFSYGMYIVSVTNERNKTTACLINTALQVTGNPLQVTVCLNKENETCKELLEERHAAITVLDDTCDMDFIGTFGFKSSNDIEKYEGYQAFRAETGDIYSTDHASAVLWGNVVDTLDLGSHILFVISVDGTEVFHDGDVLTYRNYHEVLKGKTPPRASSFIASEDTEEEAENPTVEDDRPLHKFRCTVCGFIYETYEEEMPEDYLCPICGVGPELFEKIQ